MIDSFSTGERPFSDEPTGAQTDSGVPSSPEQQHHARNILAVMRSVFSRTAESGASLEDVAAHYQGRFDTIARFLIGSGMDSHGRYDLETLVWDELQRYPVDGEDLVEVSGPPERLLPATAQPIALALHELVTNAVKFGAFDTPAQGTLAIRWWREGEDLVLNWRETGVPIVRAAPPSLGFGREFIEQGLPYQIGAETSFAIEPGGVVSTIRFPAPTGTGTAPADTGVGP